MNVGVYGLGRFGSFWASILASKWHVKGYSRSADRAVPPGVEAADESELLSCDVIFLSVAISAMEEVLRRIAPHLKPDTLVLDTCSVKVYPVQLMERILPGHVQIIATHPMFGPDSGRGGVAGLPIVYCPVRCAEETVRRWRENFQSMGLVVRELTPDEHDREAAYTQGVAHFVGRILENLQLKPSPISTVGYSKLIEIIEQTCNDPWQLFVDLQHFNPYASGMRAALYLAVDTVREKLDGASESAPSKPS